MPNDIDALTALGGRPQTANVVLGHALGVQGCGRSRVFASPTGSALPRRRSESGSAAHSRCRRRAGPSRRTCSSCTGGGSANRSRSAIAVRYGDCDFRTLEREADVSPVASRRGRAAFERLVRSARRYPARFRRAMQNITIVVGRAGAVAAAGYESNHPAPCSASMRRPADTPVGPRQHPARSILLPGSARARGGRPGGEISSCRSRRDVDSRIIRYRSQRGRNQEIEIATGTAGPETGHEDDEAQ